MARTSLRHSLAVLTLVAGLAVGAGAAYADSPVVMADDPGTLVANGAAVAVTVEYTCDPGRTSGLNVALTQAIDGSSIARGFGSAGPDELVCDSTPQSVTVYVASGTVPFVADVAFAQTFLQVCPQVPGPGPCQTSRDQREITLAPAAE